MSSTATAIAETLTLVGDKRVRTLIHNVQTQDNINWLTATTESLTAALNSNREPSRDANSHRQTLFTN